MSQGGAGMSDTAQGPGWWQASDGKWYRPEQHPSYRASVIQLAPPPPQPAPSYHGFGQPMGTVGPSPKRKRPWWRRWWAIAIMIGLVVSAIAAVSSSLEEDDASGNESSSQPVEGDGSALGMEAGGAVDGEAGIEAEDAPPADAPASNLTPSQQNAVRSAQSYLDFSGFSRQGLIDQLSSEYADQFPVEDATIAVGSLNVDWSAEALESAQSYLDLTGFSRQGLLDQLTSEFGEKFTLDQAVFAVDNADVDWNAEAAESARSYLEISGFSCQGLIDQLSSEYGSKFTVEEARYGASQAGIC